MHEHTMTYRKALKRPKSRDALLRLKKQCAKFLSTLICLKITDSVIICRLNGSLVLVICVVTRVNTHGEMVRKIKGTTMT